MVSQSKIPIAAPNSTDVMSCVIRPSVAPSTGSYPDRPGHLTDRARERRHPRVQRERRRVRQVLAQLFERLGTVREPPEARCPSGRTRPPPAGAPDRAGPGCDPRSSPCGAAAPRGRRRPPPAGRRPAPKRAWRRVPGTGEIRARIRARRSVRRAFRGRSRRPVRPREHKGLREPEELGSHPRSALTLSGLVSSFPVASHHAGIAQLVEHNLAKVGVAGSSPVSRSWSEGGGSISCPPPTRFGAVAKW